MSAPLISIDFTVFQKTKQEKVLLKKAIRTYKSGMKQVYGENWRTSGYFNVPTKYLDENKYKG